MIFADLRPLSKANIMRIDSVRNPFLSSLFLLDPPSGNTGGTLGYFVKTPYFTGLYSYFLSLGSSVLPQTTPPLFLDLFHVSYQLVGAKAPRISASSLSKSSSIKVDRSSRKKETTDSMQDFLDLWFFDWLSVTIPNSTDGKGNFSKPSESQDAVKHLFLWAYNNGLFLTGVGRGSDTYLGAASLATDPTSRERQASIRAGHSTNMPNLEINGSHGSCDVLAPIALDELGPLLVARADVSIDLSKPALFDDLLALAMSFKEERNMCDLIQYGNLETGRTFKLGKGEARVTVYEKDLERLSKDEIFEEDCDVNLVRVEFTFRPVKGKKSGIATIARESGPGALLATVGWVRSFVESLAVMVGHSESSDAVLGVKRVPLTPDPRTALDSARHGASQYAKTNCKAAISHLVSSLYAGDWSKARLLSPDTVLSYADDIVLSEMREVVSSVLSDMGLLNLENSEEKALQAMDQLDHWMDRQREEKADAIYALEMAHRSICEKSENAL